MSRTVALAFCFACALTGAAHAQPAEVAATAGPADAPAPGWWLELGSSTRWLHDASAAAVTTDPFMSTELSLARHVMTIDLPRGALDVGAELTWANGGATGTMFQSLDTKVGDNEWLAGLRGTWRLHRLLGITGRAAAGVVRTDLWIAPEDQADLASVDDHAWGRIATASLGAEVDAIRVPGFALGVGVELGYVETSAATMHAYPSDRPDPDTSIETAYASIGRIDLDGWSLRIGVHAAF